MLEIARSAVDTKAHRVTLQGVIEQNTAHGIGKICLGHIRGKGQIIQVWILGDVFKRGIAFCQIADMWLVFRHAILIIP